MPAKAPLRWRGEIDDPPARAIVRTSLQIQSEWGGGGALALCGKVGATVDKAGFHKSDR